MDSPSDNDHADKKDRSQDSKRENIPPEYLGSVLRAEIMPASEVSPDQPGIGTFIGRLNFRKVALVIVLLAIIGVSLICGFGPGKPVLENNLQKLKDRYIQTTSTNTPTSVPVVKETPQFVIIPSSSSTPTEENTPFPPTQVPTLTPTLTPTDDDRCSNAVEVTVDDVGSILCVRGTITGLEEREVGFIIYFSDERGIFYLVTYDLVWDGADSGDCIQITGQIQQLGNTPVMVFGWNNLPELCSE